MDPITEQEVENRIRRVLERFVEDRVEIDAVFQGKPILTTLTIDSLTVLNIVTELESVFDTRFDYDTIETAFENIHTLAVFLGGKARKGNE